MRRRLSILGLVSILVVACAGCSLHDPYYGHTGTKSTTTTTTAASGTQGAAAPPTVSSTSASSTTPEPNPSADPPSAAAQAGTPANVLYHFALAYGNVSAANPEQRQAALAALATTDFAKSLTSNAAEAKFGATRGLASGAAIVAQVTSVTMEPPQGQFDHGAVTILSAMRLADGHTEAAINETFVADLLKGAPGWQVAEFTYQP
jgi:hypothetical protein